MPKTYVIVSYPPSSEQIEAAIEDLETVRKSLDGTLCVLKWSGEEPPVFCGETTYNHAQILTIMHSADWSEPEPIGGD